MTPKELAAWLRGYRVGFENSGEGWNGEYPFQDKNHSPEDDDHWKERRERALMAEKERA